MGDHTTLRCGQSHSVGWVGRLARNRANACNPEEPPMAQITNRRNDPFVEWETFGLPRRLGPPCRRTAKGHHTLRKGPDILTWEALAPWINAETMISALSFRATANSNTPRDAHS